MGRVKAAMDDLELRELPLHESKFTWSRIDRMFYSTTWEEMFPIAHLQAWASTISDHCPLILQGETEKLKFRGFRFEAYWLGLPGFKDVVKQAWDKPLQATDAIRRLHIKLARTAKALKNFFLENGIKFRPLQKYTTSKLLQNSVLHAKTKETSLKK
jgi:hypothetical protein